MCALTWQTVDERERWRGSSEVSRPLSGARPEPEKRMDLANPAAAAAAALACGSAVGAGRPSHAGTAARRKGCQL